MTGSPPSKPTASRRTGCKRPRSSTTSPTTAMADATAMTSSTNTSTCHNNNNNSGGNSSGSSSSSTSRKPKTSRTESPSKRTTTTPSITTSTTRRKNTTDKSTTTATTTTKPLVHTGYIGSMLQAVVDASNNNNNNNNITQALMESLSSSNETTNNNNHHRLHETLELIAHFLMNHRLAQQAAVATSRNRSNSWNWSQWQEHAAEKMTTTTTANHTNESSSNKDTTTTTNTNQETPTLPVTAAPYYAPTLTEFAQSQLERQAAGLRTNANRETAQGLTQLVQGHQQALLEAWLLDKDTDTLFKNLYSNQQCCSVHATLLGSLTTTTTSTIKPGTFRTHPARAGHTIFCPPTHIALELDTFWKALSQFTTLWNHSTTTTTSSSSSSEDDWKTKIYHAVAKSALVLYALNDIHPFEDGNGRLSRIYANAVLKEQLKLPFTVTLVATPQQRREYIEGLRHGNRVFANLGLWKSKNDTNNNGSGGNGGGNGSTKKKKKNKKSNKTDTNQTTKGAVTSTSSSSSGTHKQPFPPLPPIPALQPLIQMLLERLAHAIVQVQSLLSKKAQLVRDDQQAQMARHVREDQLRNGQCIICLDERPNIATLCCGQAVHLNCIAEWLANGTTCVGCRSPLPRLQQQQQRSLSSSSSRRRRRRRPSSRQQFHNSIQAAFQSLRQARRALVPSEDIEEDNDNDDDDELSDNDNDETQQWWQALRSRRIRNNSNDDNGDRLAQAVVRDVIQANRRQLLIQEGWPVEEDAGDETYVLEEEDDEDEEEMEDTTTMTMPHDDDDDDDDAEDDEDDDETQEWQNEEEMLSDDDDDDDEDETHEWQNEEEMNNEFRQQLEREAVIQAWNSAYPQPRGPSPQASAIRFALQDQGNSEEEEEEEEAARPREIPLSSQEDDDDDEEDETFMIDDEDDEDGTSTHEEDPEQEDTEVMLARRYPNHYPAVQEEDPEQEDTEVMLARRYPNQYPAVQEEEPEEDTEVMLARRYLNQYPTGTTEEDTMVEENDFNNDEEASLCPHCNNRFASDCGNGMCGRCCPQYGECDCERHGVYPDETHYVDVESDQEETTTSVPHGESNNNYDGEENITIPAASQLQDVRFCGACNRNRAAMDCHLRMCGRCCVLNGMYCPRHNM